MKISYVIGNHSSTLQAVKGFRAEVVLELSHRLEGLKSRSVGARTAKDSARAAEEISVMTGIIGFLDEMDIVA